MQRCQRRIKPRLQVTHMENLVLEICKCKYICYTFLCTILYSVHLMLDWKWSYQNSNNRLNTELTIAFEKYSHVIAAHVCWQKPSTKYQSAKYRVILYDKSHYLWSSGLFYCDKCIHSVSLPGRMAFCHKADNIDYS